jgi:hypothetical protein
MRLLSIFATLLAAVCTTGCNIGICDSDVTVTNQDELNAARDCERIEGSLTIGPSDLEIIDALAGLRGIGGALRIIENSALKDLDGFIDMTVIEGPIEVTDNANLADISGIHQTTEVFGDVTITDNAVLHHLAGIIRVTDINGSFVLERNDNLDDLQGLRALENVTGDFIIRDNAILENLDGADALASVGTFTIADNPLLPVCHAERLADRVEIAEGEPDLSGNGTGRCD